MLFRSVLSFQTVSTRLAFSGLLMLSYFDKFLTDNTLEEWQLGERFWEPHEDTPLFYGHDVLWS